MNINDISSAIAGSSFKSSSRPAGKSTVNPGAGDAVDSDENVEFTASAMQKAGFSSGFANSISIENAKAETTYLRNVILALPALVLKGQAQVSAAAQSVLQD